MVDEIVTRQELIDAKRDARDLGDSVNEKKIIQPRYGAPYRSIPLVVENIENTINEWDAAVNTITQEGGIPDLAISTWSGRTQEDKNKDMIFVEDCGAKGNLSRLSSKFSSLAAAQAVYPSALTLNDTFDIVAFEKALANHYAVYAQAKTYHFNRELRIPSYRGLHGQGIGQTIIRMTDDAYVLNNILTNEGNRKQNATNSTNTANECIFIDGFTLEGNFINVQANTISDSQTNPLGIVYSSGLTKSGIVFSSVYGSGISNVEVTHVAGHCIDIAARYNESNGTAVWSPAPSRNINIDNVILSYPQDDAFTTHFSEDINLNNFIIFHASALHGNSNGVEIDDGSRLININNGFIYNLTKAVSIKAHDPCPAPFMINVNNVTAMECNISFDTSLGVNTTVGDDAPAAYGINFTNCISWLARARVNTDRNPRHIYVSAYSGVNFSNIQCYGNGNTTLPRPTLDEYDFGRPYQPVGYGGVEHYNQSVIEGNVDVTYDKMEQAIIVNGNARNIQFNNITVDGVKAQTSIIYIHRTCLNVSFNQVALNNCVLHGDNQVGLIDIGGGAKNITVNDVTATNRGAEITTYPVVRSEVSVGTNNVTISDIKPTGYKYPTQVSSRSLESNVDHIPHGVLYYGSAAGQEGITSDRLAVATGFHLRFLYGGGSTRGVFPASTSATFLGANNSAARIGSSSDETEENANYWEVGTKTSGAAFFPSITNAMSLGKPSNLVSVVYAATGTINTSDERLKQQFRSQTERERDAALEIKNSIQLFKFNDAVDLKGDGARWHCGVKAQQVISILESHDLDPFEYAFVCFDEWDETEDQPSGSRYAIRYDELSMFMWAAM